MTNNMVFNAVTPNGLIDARNELSNIMTTTARATLGTYKQGYKRHDKQA